jgi:hypothetical protein
MPWPPQEDAFRTGQMYRGPSANSLAGSGSSSDTLTTGVSASNSAPDFQQARSAPGGAGVSGRPARWGCRQLLLLAFSLVC